MGVRATSTEQHLRSDAFRDRPLRLTHDQRRLGLTVIPAHPFDQTATASRIGHSYKDATFFVDSSIFDSALLATWRALLDEPARVVLVPHVRREIEGWAAANAAHPASQALTQEAICVVDPATWPGHLQANLTYYANLLGFRKRVYQAAVITREAELGRELTEAERIRTKQEAGNTLGARAIMLARKGSKTSPASPNFYTDEILTSAAVLNAIYTGHHTVLLTRDADLFDQFYKLQWLIDTHYRGMLFADAYLADLGRFPLIEMPSGTPWDEAFAAGPNRLLLRSDEEVASLLSGQYEAIPVECWLITGTESQLHINLETPMRRLLAAKAATGGLNSEKVAPRNMHIWLAPLSIPEEFRGCAALAVDRRIGLRQFGMAMAGLDVNQAIMTGERHTVG